MKPNKQPLNDAQTEKIKIYYERIQEVMKFDNFPLSEAIYPDLHATYELIMLRGNGDPIKAANEHLRAIGVLK